VRTFTLVLQRHFARRVSRPAAHLRYLAAQGQLPRGRSGDPPRTRLSGVVVLVAAAAGLLLAAAAVAAATRPALQIHLPRAVQVEGQTLSLGAISVIRSEDVSAAARAGGVALGRAPLPAEQLVIDRPTILGRLASSGIRASQVLLSGAEKVAVSRKETQVSPEEALKAAEACLEKSRPSPAGSRWEVRKAPPPFVVPAGEVRIEARLVPHEVAGEAKVEVAASVDGRPAAAQTLLFQMRYTLREAVAAADLPPGTVLTAENVTITKVVSDQPAPADWAPPYGLTTTQAIRAGTVIRPALARDRSPRRPIAVRRSENVTMRIQGAGFTVTALGQALEDGRPGDSIKVRNVDSSRVIVARVTADGTVEPAFNEVMK